MGKYNLKNGKYFEGKFIKIMIGFCYMSLVSLFSNLPSYNQRNECSSPYVQK